MRRLIIIMLFLLTVSAGCVNSTSPSPNLSIQNDSSETVQLQIAAYRYHLGETEELNTQEESYFSSNLTIQANSNRSVEVFQTRDLYRVFVSLESQSVVFRTRPICEQAVTRVTVTSNQNITYFIKPCEGLETTGHS